MSARERILDRIRRNSGKAGPISADERENVLKNIAARNRGPVPGQPLTTLSERFIAECQRLKTTVDIAVSRSDIPQKVAQFLQSQSLSPHVAGWIEYADLDWKEQGIDFLPRPAQSTDGIGLTGCFCAVAETGTLVVLGGATTPKVTALLPETHICLVDRQRLVATMEDAFALMRNERGEPPRSVFMVSGPSRTADIEQTIVIGAHGPYRVHVLLY